MKGGALMRYRPERRQRGGQALQRFLTDVPRAAISGAVTGFKKGKGVRGRFRSAKQGAKKAVKRKVEEAVVKAARRKLNDIFGQ